MKSGKLHKSGLTALPITKQPSSSCFCFLDDDDAEKSGEKKFKSVIQSENNCFDFLRVLFRRSKQGVDEDSDQATLPLLSPSCHDISSYSLINATGHNTQNCSKNASGSASQESLVPTEEQLKEQEEADSVRDMMICFTLLLVALSVC